MAWITITDPDVTGWEYSNSPNSDKKANDTYDYDLHTDHVAGLVVVGGVQRCVLARQRTHPHPGYGDIVADIDGGVVIPPVDTYTFQDDTDILFQDGSAFDLN